MKNGIYYSAEFDDTVNLIFLNDETIDVNCHPTSPLNYSQSTGWHLNFINNYYEYICDFSNDFDELKKYKKALELSQSQLEDFFLNQLEDWSFKDNNCFSDCVTRYKREIYKILDGDL